MKKFLTTIIVIIVAVSIGFGVFYLVRDNEVISLSRASLYKNINEKFELGLDLKDPNSYTTVEAYSTNDSVVKVVNGDIKVSGKTATGQFEAVGGGVAKIVFKTNNAKFRNVSCDIIVCDGTASYPFRISSAEELASIGTNPLYTLDKCYELNNNIDLGTIIDIENGGTWTPLSQLKGRFNGNGHTIENLYVNGGENVGLFSSLASSAIFENVKFANPTLIARSSTAYMGVVAGINEGTISRVEIKDATITNGANVSACVGGVTGLNRSINTGERKTIAVVDRTSITATMNGNSGIIGYVGGIAGINKGGKIMFSYSAGTVDTSASNINFFGGIVGKNEYLQNTGAGSYKLDLGGCVQECYSIIKPSNAVSNKVAYIIGSTTDSSSSDSAYNTITGNYYENSVSGVKAIAVVSGNSGMIDSYSTRLFSDTEASSNFVSLVSARICSMIFDPVNNVVKPDETNSELFYWNTSVWANMPNQNVWNLGNGEKSYPVLTFEDVSATPAESQGVIENVVKNVEQFRTLVSSNLDAELIVTGDLDFTNINWVPVGIDAEHAFTGKIYFQSGVVVKNLTVNNGYTYAGLFGYLGKTAVIDGLNIVSCKVAGDYAGVIAGYNEGTISNFVVSNSTVDANIYGGGVVGYNTGVVFGNNSTFAFVSKTGNVENVTINGVLRQPQLGGVAGHNAGEIKSGAKIVLKGVKVNTKYEVSFAYMGGAVGYNEGTIKNVTAGTVDSNVSVTNSFIGSVWAGGIAGFTSGSIESASVVANISVGVDGSTQVGGIVGVVLFDNENKSINKCSVNNSVLHGYMVGGIAGSVSASYDCKLEISNNIWVILWSDTASVDTSNNNALMYICKVENTSLNGNITAGAIGNLSRGFVRDIYIDVTMKGNNNAGIVYTINYSAKNQQGGIISNVVSIAKNERGTGYGASSNEIHKQPLLNSRNCGMIVNYHYLKSSKLKDNNQCGWGGNQGLNESDMKDASKWSFISGTYSHWNVQQGSIPTLSAMYFI